MPDESLPNRPASNAPAQPESSLADLLPEFFESPQPVQNPSQPSAPEPTAADPFLVPVQAVPVASRRKGFNYVPLVIIGIIGMIIVPLVILGVFIFIANNQPAATTIDVASATTPLPTVFSITPGSAGTTAANGSTAPAGNASPIASAAAKSPAATANPCPPRTVFGSVELYACSQTIQTNNTFTSYIGLAELQMAQSGQNGPAANRVYAVSGDNPAKVMQFYTTSLAAQGFAPVKTNETGSTSLGPYTAALYAKGNQQVQVAVLTVNKPSPDGQLNAGQTLIRLSSS